MADIEETRAVVNASERYDGPIIPSQETAIDRPVRIRENATVVGSIYGATVTTDPEATVDGSIMASKSVDLTESHIKGEVGTPGRVVCDGTHTEGTITGKKIRLRDCVIHGNVIGTDVILENSVVLGLVAAERELLVEDSLCYTFRAEDEATVDGAVTVLPQAIVEENLQIDSPVRVAGLGEVETNEESRLPRMTVDDLYADTETQYLTLAPRILNLSKVQNRLAELEDGVLSIVENTSGENPVAAVSELLRKLDINVDSLSEDIGALEPSESA